MISSPLNPISYISPLLNIWDRFIRGRPEAYAIAEPFLGAQRYLYLLVINRLTVPIYITSIDIRPGLFEVVGGETIEDVARSLDKQKISSFLEPDKQKRFPIILSSNYSEENRNITCTVVISWRSMRHPNIPCIPVRFQTTVRMLENQRG